MGLKMNDSTEPGLSSNSGAGSTNGRPLSIFRGYFFYFPMALDQVRCVVDCFVQTHHIRPKAFYVTLEYKNFGFETAPVSRNAKQSLECCLAFFGEDG